MFNQRFGVIFPVIARFSEFSHILDKKCRARAFSYFARCVVKASSDKKGFGFSFFSKDELGIPVSFEKMYWSITHKLQYVAGVVAHVPIGLDLEKVSLGFYSDRLFNKIADLSEWKLIEDCDRSISFFRYWTAKEAVLKAKRRGLVGISRCHIKKVIDEYNMIVCYDNDLWNVKQFYFDDYIASVAVVSNKVEISWCLCKNTSCFLPCYVLCECC